MFGLASLLVVSGCNFVPMSRIEEGRRLAQTLRAENVRLKDQTLVLRTKNQDLIQRAQDDARRLAIQDEALDRLEKSVAAYQSERDQLANAFETFKRQARLTSIDRVPTRDDWNDPFSPVDDPLESFAADHPDWTLDREARTLSIPVDRLFKAGSTTLKPESANAIVALGERLGNASDTSMKSLALEVEAGGDSADLHQAIFKTDADPDHDAARRFTAASRAARVRERLLAPSALDPSRVRIAPPPDVATDGIEGESRVIIRLLPATRSAVETPPALDSKPNDDR